MWAVYVINLYVSDGFSEYTNIPHFVMRIPLPVDEEAFESGEDDGAGRLTLPYLAIDGMSLGPLDSAWPLNACNCRRSVICEIEGAWESEGVGRYERLGLRMHTLRWLAGWLSACAELAECRHIGHPPRTKSGVPT